MKWFLFCLGAGVASAFGFAPYDLWPLTLAGLAVLLAAVERAPRLRTALLRAWAFGFGQFALGLNWIATAFTYQSNMPHWVGWVAVIALSCYLAVYPAAAAGLAWRWSGGDRLRLVLLLAAAWIVTEYLRGVLFTGFPWNPLGVALLPTPAVHLAAVIGTYALAGIAILAAGAAFLALQQRWRSAAALAVAIALPALAAMPFPTTEPDPSGWPLMRIVQPNIPQAQKHAEGYGPQLARLRAAAASDGRPRLHLWPEDAIPYFLDEDPLAARRLGAWIGPGDLILTGGAKIERDGAGRIAGARNSAWLIDTGGMLRARYDKAHLVPYGEYLPARPLLTAIGLSRVVPGELDFWEGPGPRTLAVPGFGRAGIQICYEIVFSGQVVDRADRPDFIFNPSNDAWFGWWGPPQHFAQARLRAIEEGLPVVRATPTGISGLIDPAGRVVASVPYQQQGVIDVHLPPPAAATPFARIGNLAPFLFAGVLILAALLAALQSRSKRATEPRT